MSTERTVFVDGYGMVEPQDLCPECRGDGCCHHMAELTLECCTCEGTGVRPDYTPKEDAQK